MSPKSLVTGAAGFIGSHVCQECLNLGHDVVGIDDLSGGFPANVPSGVNFQPISVVDAEKIDALFQEHQFDYVYHLAAYAAEGLSHFIRMYNYQVNLNGSMALLNAAVTYGVKRFVFTSSIAVYGTGNPPYTEDQKPEPEDPYGISKYAVEMDLKAAHEMFGIDFTIFRPHNVYGEHQNIADAYRNVVCIFMNQALHGRQMSVFGDGLQTRAFSYIADVAPVIAKSVDIDAAKNQIFNVGATTPYTIKELAEVVSREMGIEENLKYMPPRLEVVHARSSTDKAIEAFDLNPDDFISLEEGVRRMAEWVRSSGAAEPVHFKAVEVDKNLPPAWRTDGLERRPSVIRVDQS
jgi:UDP-glucose 4-epimerase